MKRNSFFLACIILVLIFTACQISKTDEDIPTLGTPVTVSGGTGSFFSINEVGLGSNGFIALTNFTDVPANLTSLYLCQGSACFALPDEKVAPGETVRISNGNGEGVENVVATHASIEKLQPSDGEIALYASTDIEDPKEMLVYLQWGSTPHEYTDVAVEAGLWIVTGYAPTSANATRLFRVEESGLWLFEE